MGVVAGVFEQQMRVEQALDDLRLAGFDPQRVSVIARDRERRRGTSLRNRRGGQEPARPVGAAWARCWAARPAGWSHWRPGDSRDRAVIAAGPICRGRSGWPAQRWPRELALA